MKCLFVFLIGIFSLTIRGVVVATSDGYCSGGESETVTFALDELDGPEGRLKLEAFLKDQLQKNAGDISITAFPSGLQSDRSTRIAMKKDTENSKIPTPPKDGEEETEPVPARYAGVPVKSPTVAMQTTVTVQMASGGTSVTSDDEDCHGENCTLAPNGFQYTRLHDRLNYSNAIKTCQNRGATLMTLSMLTLHRNSSFFKRFVKFLDKGGTDGYWLPLSDKMNGSSWIWDTTGEILKESDAFWGPLQPDDNGTQDCVLLNARMKYAMDDVSCDKSRGVVCEKRFLR